jgi:hypothetical protein
VLLGSYLALGVLGSRNILWWTYMKTFFRFVQDLWNSFISLRSGLFWVWCFSCNRIVWSWNMGVWSLWLIKKVQSVNLAWGVEMPLFSYVKKAFTRHWFPDRRIKFKQRLGFSETFQDQSNRCQRQDSGSHSSLFCLKNKIGLEHATSYLQVVHRSVGPDSFLMEEKSPSLYKDIKNIG